MNGHATSPYNLVGLPRFGRRHVGLTEAAGQLGVLFSFYSCQAACLYERILKSIEVLSQRVTTVLLTRSATATRRCSCIGGDSFSSRILVHMCGGRAIGKTPHVAAWRRRRLCQRLCTSLPSETQCLSFFAASSPTSTPLRAVKFGDAPCYQAVNGCAATLRTCHVRTRRHTSALQGRLAPTKAVWAHSASLHFQAVRPSRHNLRGIFADVDVIACR